ncbi:MAG TPA: helix-turn-helix domain-containing GNAT family N-acetyltransferase [Solirubrobacteraceae bacterium]|nr:helix-turn-helix domain-containing GNAT family N-acetyltransferase [Solirubrobacteraceae bacterium]
MPDAIASVRRFNRVVTQKAGALEAGFLGLGRPLGAARVLWEIGPAGCEVRALRRRLGLDSGYLSRLLRGLEAEQLVAVAPDPADRRRRIATLTAAGHAERAELDARSDAVARAMVGTLVPAQQERLVAAMREVERLLAAAEVALRPVDPDHPDAQRCIAAYFAELDARSGGGFDPATSRPARPDLLLLAYRGEEAVACGGVTHHDGWSEVKRVWVADAARGLGLARRLMSALEEDAIRNGNAVVRLDTNRHLVEARALYLSLGYREIRAFNDEVFADHWFEKRLRR